MTIAVADGRINPTTGGIATIEHVVEVQSEDSLLHYLLGFERITERDVGDRVAWQRTVGILSIVEILPTHEIGMPDSLNAHIMKVDKAIENGRGTEGQRRVVVVDGFRAVVPILDHLVEVLDAVLTQGCIALDGKP